MTPRPARTVEALPPNAPDVESLYREHYDFVWRNARRLGCDDDWVDDAVHEIFLVAARRFAEFEGRSSVRTWLFAIALRVIQRMKRDRARYHSRIADYGRARSNDAENGSEDQREAARYLRELLSELDETRRTIVILVELEGMTAAEVAEAMKTKQGTVETRLRSARLFLKQRIERDRARFERQLK